MSAPAARCADASAAVPSGDETVPPGVALVPGCGRSAERAPCGDAGLLGAAPAAGVSTRAAAEVAASEAGPDAPSTDRSAG